MMLAPFLVNKEEKNRAWNEKAGNRGNFHDIRDKKEKLIRNNYYY